MFLSKWRDWLLLSASLSNKTITLNIILPEETSHYCWPSITAHFSRDHWWVADEVSTSAVYSCSLRPLDSVSLFQLFLVPSAQGQPCGWVEGGRDERQRLGWRIVSGKQKVFRRCVYSNVYSKLPSIPFSHNLTVDTLESVNKKLTHCHLKL